MGHSARANKWLEPRARPGDSGRKARQRAAGHLCPRSSKAPQSRSEGPPQHFLARWSKRCADRPSRPVVRPRVLGLGADRSKRRRRPRSVDASQITVQMPGVPGYGRPTWTSWQLLQRGKSRNASEPRRRSPACRASVCAADAFGKDSPKTEYWILWPRLSRRRDSESRRWSLLTS